MAIVESQEPCPAETQMESVSLEHAEMVKAFVRLNQVAKNPAIPFVLPRNDMDCAMTGFAAAPWVIELLQWSYNPCVNVTALSDCYWTTLQRP